ncbi:hypothetical protein GUITHDRAFT_136508 [Guillardia theta CCMP2712]|uniref:Uncharacterized protein n=1 Tax=Guillardia theta (strain CCMP2712) TaxID=905079 RepID=L1JKL9_GUITC|nr:hypothetical protein GUITHDRAFT_136508 [Guillardia theta CCMP2712]EKX48852.1 hypothetical protein GUITHDRAFT_136508 [Guillardia theta CCMP2712]|eukprot:XP_005835832.1 hypothetical protein GUITHDRAFT_136508 [Guillardia theta CCMP2712]
MRPSELWVLLAIIFTCQEVGRTETTKFAAAPDRLQQQDLDRKVLMSLMNTLHEQAEDGNATATRLLGCCVSLQSSRASDLTLAFRCFLTASQLGDVDSKFNLAVCYAAGRGVRQDQYKASKLFLEVADAGDAEVAGRARVLEAQYVMGKRFAEGKGCEQDIERSNELLLLAAQAGHRAASFNIAWRFMKGKGMRLRKEIQPFYLGGGTAKLLTNASKKLANTHGPDPVEAEKWFEQSATSGYAKSLYNLCNIRRKADKQVIQGSTLRLLILAAKNDYPRAQVSSPSATS